MIKINGYHFSDKIHESTRSIIYKGISLKDQQKVVVKILASEYPQMAEVERLKREFEIIQKLKFPGVIQTLGLEKYKNSPALILEDFEAQSLKSLSIQFQNNISLFLNIAVDLVTALGNLHKAKVIHKDIKPSNILVNPGTNIVKIIDFGLSTILEKETQILINPKSMEGTPEYMSPEQTGRMNRSIDFRTDFYSLGISFYEILCGHLPFTSDDPMEVLHSHIARQPVAPKEMNAAIPEVISDIIMKLLNKNAEERYQSAYGLKADLQKCQAELLNGSIAVFTPGTSDIVDWLQIPQKLYGRQKELAILLSTFKKTTEGTPQMILVSGFSGIGKSMLVHDIQKPVVENKGYFITGKFDQFNRNIPYASPIQAFRDLVRQLLTESEQKITYWKQELLKALGSNAQIIINVIPELELLIGKQAQVPELGVTESQNRFNNTFLSFVKVFTKKEHPLVLFLDDLQWADGGSLQMIDLLISNAETCYLFLIGSYRDNEVANSHPLKLAVAEIKKKNIFITELFLEPLTQGDIDALIADTFFCPVSKAASLGAMVSKKTNGNPFFINEFLKTLYTDKIIDFDAIQGIWTWDMARISQMNITGNVIEFMADKIKKLPESVQQLLKLAACLGNKFQLNTLSQVTQKPNRTIAHELMPSLKEGLVLPVGNDYKLYQSDFWTDSLSDNNGPTVQYKFIHDRVQQAAYSLIDDDKKKQFHLTIGRLLLHGTPLESKEEKIFDITNHLNFGDELITDEAEKVELARLNLIAGRKAKASSAFTPALKYFNYALKILPPESWHTYYDLSYSIHIELAEGEHHCGNEIAAEKYFEIVLNEATSKMDKAKVYEKKIHFYSNLSKFRQSYEAGKSALKLFNIKIPSPGTAKPLLVLEFLKSKIKLRGKKVADLIHLGEMQDRELRFAVKIISAVLKSAYQIAPELCVANAIKIVNLTINHGNTDDNAIAFIVFGGIFQGGVLGKHHTGYDYGRLALALNDKFNFIPQKSEVNFVFAYFSNSWKHPAKDTERYFKRALEAGLETGDFFHTGCACSALCQNMLMRGVPIDEVYMETVKYIELVKRIQNKEAEGSIMAVQQAVRNYKGLTRHHLSFEDEKFNEKEYINDLKQFGSQHFAHFYFINKMQSLFLYGEFKKAYEVSKESEKFLKHSIGMFHMTEHHFYTSLILSSLYPMATKQNKRGFLKQLKKNQKNFETWSKECPENFMHKYLLLTAEIEKIKGGKADNFYSQAIELAKENEFIQDEAIAAELAARYYLSLYNKKAEKLLSDSYYAFTKWGAVTKLAKMENDYSYLRYLITTTASARQKSFGKGPSAGFAVDSITTGSSEKMDVISVLKASQALSGEVVLEKLLKKLMTILIENAGAQTGLLILNRNGRLIIEAECILKEKVVKTFQAIVVEDTTSLLSARIVNYVARTKEFVVLNNACEEGNYVNDSYISKNKSKSILCAPLISQGKLISIIYLENNLITGAFTKDRIEVLLMLTSQAAISIDNAFLYENLEQKVQERTSQLTEEKKKVELANLEISKEKEKSDILLRNILPEETARELKLTGQATPRQYERATVMFTDFVGFTKISERLTPWELQKELNYIFENFDDIIVQHNLEKIKTIGDSYMCAGGIPTPNTTNPIDTVLAALKIQGFMKEYKEQRIAEGKIYFECRIGVNTGSIVAGVVGKFKYAYDIWGSTVNTASRMEASGEAGKVNITEATYDLVKEYFICAPARIVNAKNQGEVKAYFVEGLAAYSGCV